MKTIRFVIVSLFIIANAAFAKDIKMSVDTIPIDPLFNPKTAISQDTYKKEQDSFVHSLNDYLRGKYQLVDKRIFVYTRIKEYIPPQWILVSQNFDNSMYELNKRSEIVDNQLSANGFSALKIFKVGGKYLAIAQSNFLPDGNALVGYFELKKE